MLKPLGFCVSLFSLKEGKKKKQVEAFRVLRDQIEMWGDREFEDCNVEGSLKGKKKKLKPSGTAWENREFEHLPALPFCSNGYLSNFLPSCLPFHTVYKYWKNLPASVEVSLHLNSFFWVQNFYALFILIRDPFFSFVCVYVYIRRASLAYHWCVCEIAWMSFQK